MYLDRACTEAENRPNVAVAVNKTNANANRIVGLKSKRKKPCSTRELASNRINDGGNNQKLMLFRRGKAISGLPI